MTQTIFKAVAKAIGEVKQLGKTEKNKFDNYNFVSIDKFLTLVNPICAQNGLFLLPSQDSVEFYENTNSKGGKSIWARFTFSLTLYHESGETLPPAHTMVAVPMTGAQASGSAQSYAIKQFWRGLLLIPTGDKDDPDFNANEPHTSTRALGDAWEDAVFDNLPPDPSEETVAEAYADAILAEIGNYKTENGLNNYLRKHNRHIQFVENHALDRHEKIRAEVAGIRGNLAKPKEAA